MKKSDYVRKYKKIYDNIPEKDRKKSDEIIARLGEVLEQMDKCRMHLNKEGCVTSMCQGKYTIDRENPWSRTYDSKAKLMILLTDKLDKMVPDQKTDTVAKAGEKLAKFVSGGRAVELR